MFTYLGYPSSDRPDWTRGRQGTPEGQAARGPLRGRARDGHGGQAAAEGARAAHHRTHRRHLAGDDRSLDERRAAEEGGICP